jgi:hypothetical protein
MYPPAFILVVAAQGAFAATSAAPGGGKDRDKPTAYTRRLALERRRYRYIKTLCDFVRGGPDGKGALIQRTRLSPTCLPILHLF